LKVHRVGTGWKDRRIDEIIMVAEVETQRKTLTDLSHNPESKKLILEPKADKDSDSESEKV